MGIEDGAVLAKLFSHLTYAAQIGSFMNAFQDLRAERANESRHREMDNVRQLTISDPVWKQLRDTAMCEKTAAGLGVFEGGEAESTKRWREIETVFGYDCEDAADNWWMEWGMLRERARVESQQGRNGAREGGFVSFVMSVQVTESID